LANIFFNSKFDLFLFSDFGESKIVEYSNLDEEFFDIMQMTVYTPYYASTQLIYKMIEYIEALKVLNHP
jgi:hypothetical protein